MRRILSVVLVIFFSVKNRLHIQPLALAESGISKCMGGRRWTAPRVRKLPCIHFIESWQNLARGSARRHNQRIRGGEYPPDFPSDINDRKKRQALKSAA